MDAGRGPPGPIGTDRARPCHDGIRSGGGGGTTGTGSAYTRAVASTEPVILTRLQPGPPSGTATAPPPDCGATCIFIGHTRAETHPDLGPLLRLEYEVHPTLTRAALARLADEVAAHHACTFLRIDHAVGPIGIGEASVVIEVAAPHRDRAFAACRSAIDRLKHEVPLWKHEIWERGSTRPAGLPLTGSRHACGEPAP